LLIAVYCEASANGDERFVVKENSGVTKSDVVSELLDGVPFCEIDVDTDNSGSTAVRGAVKEHAGNYEQQRPRAPM
jgi:hypothetical protein